MMQSTLWVFLGSGLGGSCRFWSAYAIYAIFGKSFPIGTLMINVTGSFIMGFLYVLILQRSSHLIHLYQPFLLVGFLGGYTTFSSFSIESLLLIEAGQYPSAILYISLSFALCLSATWLGLSLARQL